MVSKHSLAPRALPGRLIINVFSLIPAAARDRKAKGEEDRINPIIARASQRFVITFEVASGVTSRLENPVPPVVSITSQPDS